MNNMDTSFDFCFDALQLSLSSLVSSNPTVVKLSKTVIKEGNQSRRKLEDDIRTEARNRLLTSTAARLASVRSQRDISMKRLRSDINSKHADLVTMQTFQQKELEGCFSQKLMGDRRLSSQLLTAERRIRELVFEILGEYGKSEIRFRRRQEYLSYTARIHVAWMCHRNAWDRFALRLCYEATRTIPNCSGDEQITTSYVAGKTNSPQSPQQQYDFLRGMMLDSITDADEIAGVESRLSQQLSPRREEKDLDPSSVQVQDAVRASTVIRFLKGRANVGAGTNGGGSAPNSSFRVVAPLVVNTVRELWHIRSALRMWATRPLRNVAATSNKDTRPQTKCSSTGGKNATAKTSSRTNKDLREKKITPDFLQSKAVDWLHPPAHYPHIWDRLMDIRVQSEQSTSSTFSSRAPSAYAEETQNVLTHELESFISRYSTQQSAFVASERLYYCLEERQAAGGSSGHGVRDTCDEFNAMLQQVETHYVSHADAGLLPLREQLHRKPIEILEYLGSHRDQSFSQSPIEDIATLGSCYPDVVKTHINGEATNLHFVAATTFNLLETQAFIDHSSSDPLDNASLRKIVSRGAYPPGLIKLKTDPALASDNNNMSATEAENSMKYTLDTSRTASLRRLYCLVSVVENEKRNVNIPVAPAKKEAQRMRKGRRNASNRHSSLCRRRKSTSPTNTGNTDGDDSAGEEDEAELTPTDEADGTTYVSRDEISPPTQNASKQIMLPLSDLCMQELLRSEFWPLEVGGAIPSNVTSTIATAGENTDKLRGRRKSGVRGSAPPASFVNLIPDQVRLCLSPGENIPSEVDFQGESLNHKYILINDEFRETSQEDDESSVGGGGRQSARQCYYLVQLENVNEKDKETKSNTPQPNASAYGEISKIHKDDDQHLANILNARRAGFGLPGGSTNLSREKSNAVTRGSPRKTKDGGNMSTADDDDDSAKSKRKWDPTVLSTVCRWRSCLSECAPDSLPRYLCPYHTSLYVFLEGPTKVGSGEAAKYLPKKAPLLLSSSTLSDSRKDLLMIRAASTLLQELWDGKLRATMRSFTKKVNQDMGLRRRLENSLSLTSAYWTGKDLKDSKKMKPKEKTKTHGLDVSESGNFTAGFSSESLEQSLFVPPSPTWSHWKDEDVLNRTMHGQGVYSVAMEGVLKTEIAISEELTRMLDLHVFPSQELTVIKKEVKAFKESFENAITFEANSPFSAVYYENTATQGSKSATAKNAQDYLAMILAESKLGDRKLGMLRSRRLEEHDNRQAQARRNARVRAIEETQSKDPANFSRQRF